MPRRSNVVAVKIVPNPRELKAKLRKLNPQQQKQMLTRALIRSALVVTRNAQNEIIRGGSGPPHPSRLTSRSGTGRRSITPDRVVTITNAGFDFEINVGTPLDYMALHEHGGVVERVSSKGKAFRAVYPRRAYLEPGLDKSQHEIESIFSQEWRRLAGAL